MQIEKQRMNIAAILITAVIGICANNNAWAIKKCTDANGKTHYGDTAQAACDSTKVTTLNDRGFIKHDADRPKTANELALEAEAQLKAEEEAKLEREAEEERIRILSVYETEEDIDRQLANQLGSVETSIAVHETYITQMQAQIKRIERKREFAKGRGLEMVEEEIGAAMAKIEESKKELTVLAEESKNVKARFQREKELFRDLRAEQAES